MYINWYLHCLYLERLRKFETIILMYKIGFTQEKLAEIFNTNIQTIRKVTYLGNYWHGKHKTPENLREGQTIKAVISGEELDFLDDVVVNIDLNYLYKQLILNNYLVLNNLYLCNRFY